jgi:hypothetical protein
LPAIHQIPENVPFRRSPFFHAADLWTGLGDALAARSSANAHGGNDPQIWIWIGLLCAGIIVAAMLQRKPVHRGQKPEGAANSANPDRSDRALFCVVSIILAIIGYSGFLLRLQFFMQPWYYLQILVLCIICLDGILTANWPAFRPWGLMRVIFLVEMMVLNARPAWAEARTRRSNLDVVGVFLSQKASGSDLILVQDAWEGVTFNRYYRGEAQWLSVPPIDSHEVHRVDLAMARMNQPEAMAPVLRAITDTLIRRPRCLGGGEHTHGALNECATRVNSVVAPAVRNAHPMVVRVVFILVEPTGYSAATGSRAARKGGNNCRARTGEPF